MEGKCVKTFATIQIISFHVFCICSEKVTKLGSKPEVVSVTGWDGKDAVVQADEIPLDELFGDEL